MYLLHTEVPKYIYFWFSANEVVFVPSAADTSENEHNILWYKPFTVELTAPMILGDKSLGESTWKIAT